MAAPSSAEQLAQAALDVGVVNEAELRSVWSEVGSANAGMGDFSQALVRKGLVTNYQLERIERGFRDGYFYGDYKVLYCVGSGTFARVFRAIHRDTGEIHAVKVLRSRFNQDPKRSDFFRREGELGKGLKHDNIVPVQDVVSRPGLNYIVMDFIEGRNLRETYRVRGKFPWQEASKVIADVMAGLHYAFQQGVTHRDLKMSNVLVSSEGVGKLIDFGLAALDGVSGEAAGVDRTVEYAALEKATGVKKDDTRSDVFFAGCMLHQLLTGVATLPEGKERAQRLGRETFTQFRPIIELAPETPMPIIMVAGKALELDPQRRFQTPGDMLTEMKLAIRRAEGGGGTGEAKAALTSQEGLGPDGEPRRIMVVESDVKRQDILRELFKKNGYRVLVASDPERAMDRISGDPASTDVVLFCAATIGARAVHAFNEFGVNTATKTKPALLLLEEAQGGWRSEADSSGHRTVAVMPLKQKQLRSAVAGVLQAVEA